MLILLQKRIGGLNARDLLDGLWRMGVATGIMTVAVLGVTNFLPFTSPWLLIPVGGAVGGVVYFGVSQLLNIRELARFTQPILSRLGRGGGS